MTHLRLSQGHMAIIKLSLPVRVSQEGMCLMERFQYLPPDSLNFIVLRLP